MQSSRSGTLRLLALLAAMVLIVGACAGDQATQAPGGGETDPPGTTPAATMDGESPAATMDGESPAATDGGESPAATDGEESPAATDGAESPGPTEGAGETPAATDGATATMGPMPEFEQIGGSVSVIASWTGSEQDSFMAMLQPWMDGTGVQVNYTGTRDMQAQLTSAIQAGGTGLPDVAGIPGPGLARDWYATQLSDGTTALKPLDFLNVEEYQQSTPPGMAELGIIDGTLVGIFIKAAVKGLIWYNVNNHDGSVPESFEALQGVDAAPAGARWCLAWESGPASGWPGTDWIEDILIRQSGPEAYDAWVNGELAWTSTEVRSAFETLGSVIENARGGGSYINATNFQNVGDGLFSDPAECKFVHQASFISDFFVNTSGAAPEDFDFFVMPDINTEYSGALTGGGDMFGMFNDTPQARSLMQWLASPHAQQIWAQRGGFIAADTRVPVDAYTGPSDQKAGEALQAASAFRFDGSDSMPGEMNEAFFTAMVDFASNPGNLDAILQRLDEIQADAY